MQFHKFPIAVSDGVEIGGEVLGSRVHVETLYIPEWSTSVDKQIRKNFCWKEGERGESCLASSRETLVKRFFGGNNPLGLRNGLV